MLTCPVIVWLVLTGLIAVAGGTWMLAAKHVFTAGPEFPAFPSVVTVTFLPPIEIVAVAVPVTLPAELETNVIVHWPFASVFGPAFVQEPVGAEWTAPLESVSVTSTCAPAAGTRPFPVSC